MTISKEIQNDLQKRVEQMSLAECEKILAYMPDCPEPVDLVLMGLLEDRIEHLKNL